MRSTEHNAMEQELQTFSAKGETVTASRPVSTVTMVTDDVFVRPKPTGQPDRFPATRCADAVGCCMDVLFSAKVN
jgi:hypothetical protein